MSNWSLPPVLHTLTKFRKNVYNVILKLFLNVHKSNRICPLYLCCAYISFLDFELGAGDKDLTMQALLVFDNTIFRKHQIFREKTIHS